ncbi:MAG: hypothetical protein EPO45_19820 [Sphingobium sp.]|nr:MAG: hypothetical protein EPO45_19820 [Sphingobium sp.]
MATQPLALTLPLDDPARTAAQGIADRLSEGRPVARNDLLAGMTSAFGGSSADGSWSLRDAYDVLELAQILELLDWKPEALPHLKAAGCFTEIIQHRTRLFVPPSRAVEILGEIAG